MSGFGVTPWQLEGSAAQLRRIVDDLVTLDRSLEHDVTDLLDGWQGELGEVVASRWQLWHAGAGEVIAGLDLMADLLDGTALAYAAAAQASMAS